MSLSKENAYAVGDVNLTNMMISLNDVQKGFHAVSLTEWATTTVPKIAAGSIVECDGVLYKAAADETISGSPSDGTVYIKLVPAGSTCTAEFTNTAPIWNTSKQGWYSPTGGEESYRYLNFRLKKATAVYGKECQENNPNSFKRIFSLKLSADQSLLVNGDKVNFNTIIYDTLSEYDSGNTRFKSKRSGYIKLNLYIQHYYGNNYRTFGIKINGSYVYYVAGATATDVGQDVTHFNKIIYLNVDDYFEVFAVTSINSINSTDSYLEITDY